MGGRAKRNQDPAWSPGDAPPRKRLRTPTKGKKSPPPSPPPRDTIHEYSKNYKSRSRRDHEGRQKSKTEDAPVRKNPARNQQRKQQGEHHSLGEKSSEPEIELHPRNTPTPVAEQALFSPPPVIEEQAPPPPPSAAAHTIENFDFESFEPEYPPNYPQRDEEHQQEHPLFVPGKVVGLALPPLVPPFASHSSLEQSVLQWKYPGYEDALAHIAATAATTVSTNNNNNRGAGGSGEEEETPLVFTPFAPASSPRELVFSPGSGVSSPRTVFSAFRPRDGDGELDE